MTLKESGEMYLETILILSMKKPFVRSIDVVDAMGYSKPSVSRAMGLLREGGYITVECDGSLHLTELGKETAERTYERHKVLSKFFINIGVNEKTATEDACRIEHVISNETFAALKKYASLE